jgi:hypothetical protein
MLQPCIERMNSFNLDNTSEVSQVLKTNIWETANGVCFRLEKKIKFHLPLKHFHQNLTARQIINFSIKIQFHTHCFCHSTAV